MLAQALRNIYSRLRLRLGHQLRIRCRAEAYAVGVRRFVRKRLDRFTLQIRHTRRACPLLLKSKIDVCYYPSQKAEEMNLVHL